MTIQRLPKPENNRGANIKPYFSGDGSTVGNPTLPALARGLVDGSLIAYTNNKIEHMCDFIDDLNKNVELKKFIKATAAYIRDGIRRLLEALGGDPTGIFSWIADTMRAIARELKRIQKEIVQPIIDFEKYVLGYIVRVRKIIAWINSLPARFKALLAACLAKLMALINNIFTDFFMELTAGTGIGDVFAAYNELAQAAYDLRASVQIAIGGVGLIEQGLEGIASDISGKKGNNTAGFINGQLDTNAYVDLVTTQASSIGSIPTSQADLDKAHIEVINYQQTVVTALDVPTVVAIDKPNKSGP